MKHLHNMFLSLSADTTCCSGIVVCLPQPRTFFLHVSDAFFTCLTYNHPMPRPPEQPPQTEVPQFPFLMASRFDSRETIVREQEVAEFSVYRLIQNWPESISTAPPSMKRWYVAVIGHPPPEPLLTQVTDAINTGEPV